MQPTLPFGLSVPRTSIEQPAVSEGVEPTASRAQDEAAESGSFQAVIEAQSNAPEGSEANAAPLPAAAFQNVQEPGQDLQQPETVERREWPYSNAPRTLGLAPAAVAPPSAAFAALAVESEASPGRELAGGLNFPTVPRFELPEYHPSPVRRFVPLAVALAAVVIAFVVGVQVGKMSPSAPSADSTPESPTNTVPKRARVSEPKPPPAPPVKEVEASSEAPSQTAAEAPSEAPSQAAAEAPSEALSQAAAEAPSEAPSQAPAEPDSEAPASESAPAPVKALAAFNAKAAGQSLGKAFARAKACKKTGNPGGTAAASVTFAASGRVEDVMVSGARIGGTPMAACIAATLRTARVAPFSGEPQTLKKTFKFD